MPLHPPTSFARRRQSPTDVEDGEAETEVAGLAEEGLEAVWTEGARAELEEKAGLEVQVVRSRRKRPRRKKRSMFDRTWRFHMG